MQSSPFPRYLVPPRSKYSPQHQVLKHPQLPFRSSIRNLRTRQCRGDRDPLQGLNSASELISLSGEQCALVKYKLHMNITIKRFYLHLFLDFFLHFTHQLQTVIAKCDIFVFVVCSSYPLFNLFSCSVRRIKAMQMKSDDNECPWNIPNCISVTSFCISFYSVYRRILPFQ